MKRIALILLLYLLTAPLVLAAEKPTDESLIKAWEQLQKNNPNNIKFEKIADRRYKFQSKLFPFDGELKILNIVIGPAWDRESDSKEGSIDLDLVGTSDDFYRKYSNSYATWAKNNTLYYYPPAARWMTDTEFQDAVTKKAPTPKKSAFCIGDYIWYILWVLIIGIYIWYMKKYKASLGRYEVAIALSEKNLREAEETNKLLKEILTTLQKKE